MTAKIHIFKKIFLLFISQLERLTTDFKLLNCVSKQTQILSKLQQLHQKPFDTSNVNRAIFCGIASVLLLTNYLHKNLELDFQVLSRRQCDVTWHVWMRMNRTLCYPCLEICDDVQWIGGDIIIRLLFLSKTFSCIKCSRRVAVRFTIDRG